MVALATTPSMGEPEPTRLLGGDGSDLYTVDHAGDVVTETNAAAAGGTDTVNAQVDHTLGANVENLNLIAAGAVNGTGNALDNLIYAGAGNNVIDGAGGTRHRLLRLCRRRRHRQPGDRRRPRPPADPAPTR
jgi:Ca2+-binding RTX toxin-like protein